MIGWIVLIVLVVLLFAAIGIYNTLVRLRKRCDNGWAQIDVQLKRRYDLIPNLVETAKGYLKHEREVLENVTKARQQAIDAGCAAVRVNPGNIRQFDDKVGEIAAAAKAAGVSLRIGVNALEIEVVMDEPDLGVAPPWQGGGGLLITVAQLAGPDAIDSRHAVDIGVGFDRARVP